MKLWGSDEMFDLPTLMPLVWTGVPLVAEPSMTETVPVVPDETWSRWKRFRFWLEDELNWILGGRVPWKMLPRWREAPADAVLLVQHFPGQSYTIIAHPAVIDRIKAAAETGATLECSTSPQVPGRMTLLH